MLPPGTVLCRGWWSCRRWAILVCWKSVDPCLLEIEPGTGLMSAFWLPACALDLRGPGNGIDIERARDMLSDGTLKSHMAISPHSSH